MPRIRNFAFDCADPYALALFWANVMGRDVDVERILGLGASFVADHRNADGTGGAVLADPEGNEFCVLRSAGR